MCFIYLPITLASPQDWNTVVFIDTDGHSIVYAVSTSTEHPPGTDNQKYIIINNTWLQVSTIPVILHIGGFCSGLYNRGHVSLIQYTGWRSIINSLHISTSRAISGYPSLSESMVQSEPSPTNGLWHYYNIKVNNN